MNKKECYSFNDIAIITMIIIILRNIYILVQILPYL